MATQTPQARRGATNSISSTTGSVNIHSARTSIASASTITGSKQGASDRNSSAAVVASAQSLSQLDNTKSMINASVLDFLLIEMVPLARRVVADVKEMNTPRGESALAEAAEKKRREQESKEKQESKDADSDTIMKTEADEQTQEDINKPPFTALTRADMHKYPNMSSIDDEDVFYRTELYGYRVGRSLAEVITRDMARLTNQLSVLKFVCKELWVLVYGKPIDNLKTNHRGTYVLIDNNFQPCERMGSAGNLPLNVFYASPGVNGGVNSTTSISSGFSNGISGGSSLQQSQNQQNQVQSNSSTATAGTMSAAAPYIWFPLGVIRGALAALGVEATVSFVATQSPAVSFNVHTTNAIKR